MLRNLASRYPLKWLNAWETFRAVEEQKFQERRKVKDNNQQTGNSLACARGMYAYRPYAYEY